MKTSRKIKINFHSMYLGSFWCTQLNTFLQLAKTSLEVLVLFSTTYLRESSFSTLLGHRN